MKKKWLKLTLLTFSIGILAVISIYAYSIIKFSNAISTTAASTAADRSSAADSSSSAEENVTIPKWEGKERVNVLILGGDSRGDDAGRSDSVMVLSIDPSSKKVHLFSVLRDTYVDIPGHGRGRLNAAFAYGGTELTRQTVSKLLGITIHNYIYTDFNGFISLVDALGGVDIEVEKDMYYTDSADKHMYDIDLKSGLQHMDGKTALQYVRFRHDATSDFSRTERQRNFLTQVANKMQSTSTIFKIPGILNAIAPYIQTDLSPTQMLKLASLGMDLDVKGMDRQQLPPYSLLKNEVVGGAQVLGVNKKSLQQYVQQVFEKDAAEEKQQ
ncbi:LCP family protein [Paenibacillus sp. JX-17]|uniref:LCP family protein n=1 Tax=Paenibacillus lacisoli TaxID=3064525 RepID=A0ABT9C970_9BACL|nr:LCP family protein [Paenibacillus sp. JX-17]MDO7905214.1 LCP family protein [Paenibacillus sp. JX-17]